MHAKKHPHQIIQKKNTLVKHNFRGFCLFFRCFVQMIAFAISNVSFYRSFTSSFLSVDAIVVFVYILFHGYPQKVDNMWITFSFFRFLLFVLSAFCKALRYFSTYVDNGLFFCGQFGQVIHNKCVLLPIFSVIAIVKR